MAWINGEYKAPTNKPRAPSNCNTPTQTLEFIRPYLSNSDFIWGEVKQANPKNRNEAPEKIVKTVIKLINFMIASRAIFYGSLTAEKLYINTLVGIRKPVWISLLDL